MLVDMNNRRSIVNTNHVLVGCAMRTVTYILTKTMVNPRGTCFAACMAHPTIVILLYFDLSCQRITVTSPSTEIIVFEHYSH